jgi:predicted TIM-barrel fold metal-dependent hydrolase
MALTVDFHTHAFPGVSQGPIGQLRKKARRWTKPLSTSFHEAQTFLRVLPESLRKPIDELGMLAPLAGLLVESTADDLVEAMSDAQVDYAVLIAHPPYLTNESLLEICKDRPQFIPAVNVASGTSRPGVALKSFLKNGARLLKIHPAMDGEGVDSPRYKALLKVADDQGIVTILHTGCVHSHLVYKDPAQGRVQKFAPWFEMYKNIPFVLAHTNFHEPNIALDLAEEYPNLRVDTSWQPSEIIGESVRRIGAERVLFGSDWPLVGNNIAVGIKRIHDCMDMGMITSEQARMILGQNAESLLGLESDAD